MATKGNKYRVGVYLGKDLYLKLEQMAKGIGLPLSTTLKLILQTGFMFEDAIEKEVSRITDD